MKSLKNFWFETREEALECNCEEPGECPNNGYLTYGHGSDAICFICPKFAAWSRQSRIQNRLDESLPLKFRSLGFGNYEPRSPQSKKAYDISLKYYDKRAYRMGANLIITGSYGTGKTHLAAAIAHNVLKTTYDTAAFVTASQLRLGGYEEIEKKFNLLQSVDLLVIDDISNELDNKLIAQHMFTLINYRYEAELGLVITTNLDISDLRNSLGERIFDRIKERSAILEIKDVESYRSTKRSEYLEWMEE